VEWPDRLPEEFARLHGVSQLRDTAVPKIPAGIRREARRYAAESVAAIKKEVFPLHIAPPDRFRPPPTSSA
ncbi:MAG: hypothetical protein AAB528_01330, partial [Chloroflexota bacterium]